MRREDTLLYTLVAGEKGWAAFTPQGRYKYDGDVADCFWFVSGLVRYEVSEIDEFAPERRLPLDAPMF